MFEDVRHPAEVVQRACALTPVEKETWIANRASVSALLAAGREVVPFLFQALSDPPNLARDQCELALLAWPWDELRELAPEGMMIPPDIGASLAVRLLEDRPAALVAWALSANEMSFREVAERFRSLTPIAVGPAAGQRERALVLAVGRETPHAQTILDGLAQPGSGASPPPCPLLVWTYLVAAQRLPTPERETLIPHLLPLCESEDDEVASRALGLLAKWDRSPEPADDELLSSLAAPEKRALALRSLTRRWRTLGILEEALRSEESHRVRCEMVAQLGHLQTERIPEWTLWLKSSFFSERIIERRRAANVIESWGPKAVEARPLLEGFLREPGYWDSDIQSHLKRALTKIEVVTS